jgi:hypothetical protein
VDLGPYVDDIRNHLVVAADAGGEDARALAERLIAPLDAAVRLALQEALAVAAAEITVELAPGSVDLRVRGRDLAFVVTPPPVDAPMTDADEREADGAQIADASPVEDDGETARINVRMPESLKARVEQAAAAQRLSVNAWLVRAAGAAVERNETAPRPDRRGARGTQRYTGWAK